MRLTVLGSSPAWPDAGGACSGYLVEHEGSALMLDCGPGAFSRLRLVRDYMQVEAVVISHLHADHFLDLAGYAYALTISPRAGSARPRLVAPPGARATLRSFAGTWGDQELIEEAFEIEEYEESSRVAVGAIALSFREVPHYVQTFAVALEAGGARMVFGADCGPNTALVDFARGADLLLAEATLSEPDASESPGHLSAREAGEHACAAGVRRLVLTHYSDELSAIDTRAEGSAGFGGARIGLAEPGAVYVI